MNRGSSVAKENQSATIKSFLSRSKLFGVLKSDELDGLVEVCELQDFGKGETLFWEGEKAKSFWVVYSGRVHMKRFLADGRAAAICVMSPGEPFCCFPAMDERAYPSDGVAAEPSTVIRIPMADFRELFLSNPTFNKEALCLFCDRLRQIEGRGCLIHETADVRLAKILLDLKEKFKDQIPLTRQELAELVGLTLETTIRILGQFKNKGWIESTRGRIRVLNPEELAFLAGIIED